MNANEFEETLKKTGYKEIATKTMEPRPANGEHAHEFSVRGLVSAGEFIISCAGVPRSYKAGQIFEVAAGEMHTEAVGPEGTRITTGRMY
jgi:hypothetical protein